MTPSDPASLTHLDAAGRARMVDVGAKPITARSAIAEGRVRINGALEEAIRAATLAKGDLLAVARLAGIQGAKRTSDLVPLCHPLPLDHVEVDATLEPGAVMLRASVAAQARTGVEMEALAAVVAAALAVVDMGKSLDPRMVIEGVRVLEKHGGRRGSFTA